MHTNITALTPRLPSTWRWLIALLAALAVTLSLAATAHAAQPPQAACTYSTPTTLQCELWARSSAPGAFTPTGGSPLTVWGYADTPAGVITMPGGPTIVANEGDTVEVVLHNDLAGETTSLALHGQGLPADPAGVGFGGSTTYTFTASQAGTFLYEAGLTANGAKQVALGLYGVLIVQPAVPAPYETVLLLSEIDPALNADPAGFNMLDYAPKYWLMNGESYPDTDLVQAPAGSTLLVRYVNAGLTDHAMGLLGLDQLVIAKDGHPRPNFRAVSESLVAGQTMDTLITMPGTPGARYPLYDTNRHLDNNGTAGGGMMTFLEAAAVVADLPPTVSVTNPADLATVSGSVTIDAAAGDDSGVTQVEFFVDAVSVGVDTNGGDGWSAAWDTTTATNASHSLTAVATDTALQTTPSAAVNVTVNNAPPPPTTMHIGAMDNVSTNAPAGTATWTAGVMITIHDTNHAPVGAGVTVSGSWSGAPGFLIPADACVTNASGQCTVTRLRAESGFLASANATFTVTGVSGGSLTYASGDNHAGPALTVPNPPGT